MISLIFGCGYLGRRVATRSRELGHEVWIVTRSAQRAEDFASAGFHPLVADVTDRSSLVGLPAANTVLYAVGYDRATGRSISEVYIDGWANVLQALPAGTGRVIYISSTGVYGQDDGSWVDEDSPCRPSREGGRACLAAEDSLRGHPLGSRSVILRMAGIYGPGRVPRRQDLVAGRPLDAPRGGQLNLIHVEDAAEAVLAAERTDRLPALYCVSDGHPAERSDYYGYLAELCGVPAPRFVPPKPGSPAAARAASSKRISNARLLRDLDVRLRYPSFREGLQAILQIIYGDEST